MPLNNLRHESTYSSSLDSLPILDLDLNFSHVEPRQGTTSNHVSAEPINKVLGEPAEAAISPHSLFHGGAHEKRQAAVNAYLLDNPESYRPSQSFLEDLKETIMKEIFMAVRDLLEGTNTICSKTPQLYLASSSLPFLEICKRIYGVGSQEELWRTSGTLLTFSPDVLSDFLRAIIAAAVNDWVLIGRHDFLPNDIHNHTGMLAIFMSEIAKGRLFL